MSDFKEHGHAVCNQPTYDIKECYVESRKMVQMNQFAGQNRDTHEEKRHMWTQGLEDKGVE